MLTDCDDHYVRTSLPPGLKPFWTLDLVNISDATNSIYLENESAYKLYSYLGFL